jgi:hypothetical protein
MWNLCKWEADFDSGNNSIGEKYRELELGRRNTENSTWEGHEDSVVSCAVFGRGRGQMVLSWSEDSTLRIWELPQVWDDSFVAKAKCLRTFGERAQSCVTQPPTQATSVTFQLQRERVARLAPLSAIHDRSDV